MPDTKDPQDPLAIATRPPLAPQVAHRPEVPLVTAEEAVEMWANYQALENTILASDDYLWFVEYEWRGQGDKSGVAKKAFARKDSAESFALQHRGATLTKRKKKSACSKMARFFGLQIPDPGMGEIETRTEGDFIIEIERGASYVIVNWLKKDTLEIIKSATRITIQSQTGRTWVERGGAHKEERGWAHAAHDIPALSWTRAVNRCILRIIGWGEESAEEDTTEMAKAEDLGPQTPNKASDLKTGRTKDEVLSGIAALLETLKWSQEQQQKRFKELYGVYPSKAPFEKLVKFEEYLKVEVANPPKAPETPAPQQSPAPGVSLAKDPNPPQTVNALKMRAARELGYDAEKILELLNIGDLAMLVDIPSAWETLRALKLKEEKPS